VPVVALTPEPFGVTAEIRPLHLRRHCCLRASCGFLLIGFFKQADANFSPGAYRFTTAGAPDETVIGRVVRDDEFIAAAITTSERGGFRHGACRPFCPALLLALATNLVFLASGDELRTHYSP